MDLFRPYRLTESVPDVFAVSEGRDARALYAPPAMSFLKLQPTQLNGRTFSKRVCTLKIKKIWVGSSIES